MENLFSIIDFECEYSNFDTKTNVPRSHVPSNSNLICRLGISYRLQCLCDAQNRSSHVSFSTKAAPTLSISQLLRYYYYYYYYESCVSNRAVVPPSNSQYSSSTVLLRVVDNCVAFVAMTKNDHDRTTVFNNGQYVLVTQKSTEDDCKRQVSRNLQRAEVLL